MIAVIQRIRHADVSVGGDTVGSSGEGLLVMLGVREGDTEEICDRMADKLEKLRIFENESGKLSLSVSDVAGSVLVISNFTLCASCRHGNRPDFTSAERPQRANELYLRFAERLRLAGLHTETGVFGADMKINAQLDGPVTIVLDSEKDITCSGRR